MVLQKLPAALQEEAARDSFQVSGALGLIQQLNRNPNPLFGKLVGAINVLFPEQVPTALRHFVSQCCVGECKSALELEDGRDGVGSCVWG